MINFFPFFKKNIAEIRCFSQNKVKKGKKGFLFLFLFLFSFPFSLFFFFFKKLFFGQELISAWFLLFFDESLFMPPPPPPGQNIHRCVEMVDSDQADILDINCSTKRFIVLCQIL